MRTHATLRSLGMPPLTGAGLSAAADGDDMPLDLSSHHQIGIGPSSAIMRAQGSARCRVQMALPISDLKDASANENGLITDGLWGVFCFWQLGAS